MEGNAPSSDDQDLNIILFDQMGLTKESLLTFCDALFSIAITLLVLDIRLPTLPSVGFDAAFLNALWDLRPPITGFLISFFVIASFWLSLHRTYYLVTRLDRTLIWLTITFLFTIAMMPFPTYVLGLYGTSSVVAIFYALMLTISSVLLHLIWRYARKGHRLIAPDLDEKIINAMGGKIPHIALVFLSSIPLALIDPGIAEIYWIVGTIAVSYHRKKKANVV